MTRRDPPRRSQRRLLLACAALAAVGCADPTTGTVSGLVTIDDNPVKAGSIAFFPTSGRGTTSGAEIIDGRYTAEVPLGEVKIEIRVPKVVGEKKLYDLPDSPIKDVMAESLPPRYNDQSELRFEVKPGNNERNFPLASE